jgi:hypothetical protein
MVVGFGQNSYKAVSEAAILNVAKPLLKKHGLILIPVNIVSEEIKDVFNTAKGEVTRLMTKVTATYKIIDIDTGEFELLMTYGHGVDTQDKASGKALTYSYKALLQKTFMLFSGEDTDNEHSEDITARNTRKVISTDTPEEQEAVEKVANSLINDIKKKSIIDLATKVNVDMSKILEFCQVDSIDKITERQYLAVANKLNATAKR